MRLLPLTRALSSSLLALSLLSGCHQAPTPRSTGDAPATSGLKTFPIRGKIVRTDATHVMLDHEAIPGFMDAMTMSYKLKDPAVISELHPGDRITATLFVHPEPDGSFSGAYLDKIVIVAQARPDYKPTVQYHVPTPGDPVPDFKLLNQAGRTLHMDQFRGKALLITFIYTRCPFADFCPRMSHNFAEIDTALAQDPSLYAHTHLLSISFDPAYDTPAILRRYGQTSTGRGPKETFSHWDFAAPSAKDLPALTQFFNVGITGDDPKTLAHSLSTVLIGKDGRIAAWYPTNDWQPAAVLADLKHAATA